MRGKGRKKDVEVIKSHAIQKRYLFIDSFVREIGNNSKENRNRYSQEKFNFSCTSGLICLFSLYARSLAHSIVNEPRQ